MYLKENLDIAAFLKQIPACRGEVFFRTPEGDCLALKSTLSQYIFCTLAADKNTLRRGTLHFEDPADIRLLGVYLL